MNGALRRVRAPRLATMALLFAFQASATQVQDADDLSLQGYSGFLNVPTAWVHRQGSAHFLVTTQADPAFRRSSQTRSYILSAGFLPYLEGGLRLSEADAPSGLQDLSLNLKLQLPLELLWPTVPFALAVGTQDEGGAAPNFRTRYVVASAEAWRFRATAGYGTGPDRMRGLFGGVEFRAFDFARLIVEHDGMDQHAGVRITVPVTIADVPLKVGLVAKTTYAYRPGTLDWAATLSAPLSLQPAERLEADLEPWNELKLRDGTPASQLEEDLLEVGFENVRAAETKEALHVEYENNVFGHAEWDGLGVVLGYLAHRATAETFSVTILKLQTPLANISGNTSSLRQYFGQQVEGAPPHLRANIKLTRVTNPAPQLEGKPRRNCSALHTQLILQPGLRYFVGTELGPFEAIISARPELVIPLWRGGSAYVRADVPVAWTQAFGANGGLAGYRTPARVEHALLTQALALPAGVRTLIAAGVYRTESAGVLGEVEWAPGGGAHAFGLQGAVTRTLLGAQTNLSATAGYRYYGPLDILMSVKGGQFLHGDRGAQLEVSRFFGDVLAGAFVSRTTFGTVLGAQVSLPLTPRRELTPGWVQLRGARRWSTQLGTQIAAGANFIRGDIATHPSVPFDLETTYADGGRLTQPALLKALPRLRRAFEWQKGQVP